ncbi:MAG: hypothetical protein ACTSPB_26810 [Candidatus Thorarchaeota archaeon]
MDWETRYEAMCSKCDDCEVRYDPDDFFKCSHCGAEFVIFDSSSYGRIYCPICLKEVNR